MRATPASFNQLRTAELRPFKNVLRYRRSFWADRADNFVNAHNTELFMTKNNEYEALKEALLADIAKTCDDTVVQRKNSLLHALEAYTTGACAATTVTVPPRSSYTSFDTDDEVQRLAAVNLVALVAMAVVAIASVVGHK
jgi:hypothetical protein